MDVAIGKRLSGIYARACELCEGRDFSVCYDSGYVDVSANLFNMHAQFGESELVLVEFSGDGNKMSHFDEAMEAARDLHDICRRLELWIRQYSKE